MLHLFCTLFFITPAVVFSWSYPTDHTTADNLKMKRFRPFLPTLEMDDDLFVEMIQDLFQTIVDSCEENTEYSYWRCNSEDVMGTLIEPDSYVFANETEFPGRIQVATTPMGAFIQGIAGAFLTQKIHEYRVKHTRACEVGGANEVAASQSTGVLDSAERLRDCVKKELRDAEDHFKIFLRRYIKYNPITEGLLLHNMYAGSKLFVEYVQKPDRSPCVCVLKPCVSMSVMCYNHNTQADFHNDLAAHIMHWVSDAREAKSRVGDRLYDVSDRKISYRKVAFIQNYTTNCQTVLDRPCVRSKSYQVCNPRFSSKSVFYQRYLKKSCPNLCGACSLSFTGYDDEHGRMCSSSPAKAFKCSAT